MFGFRFFTMATLFLYVTVSSFAGTKYAVGTCQPKLPFYTTISQAVSSVPSGATIVVCPGQYPEQVVITQPLTLQGIAVGGSDAAVVVVPPGGLTQNLTDPAAGTVYYQILVQSGPVNITNLVVDGTGNSAGAQVAGIFLEDVSGTLSNVSIRNEITDSPYEPGNGIIVDALGSTAQTVTIENSVISGFNGAGIFVSSIGSVPLTANIKTNTVDGEGLGAQGISVFQATGVIQSNTITGASVNGFHLESSATTMIANTISGAQACVFGLGGSNIIKNNRCDGSGNMGVVLMRQSTNSIIQANTIVNASTAVFGCGQGQFPEPASGFTVTGNTIIGATVGVEMPSGNTNVPNTVHATTSAVGACN